MIIQYHTGCDTGRKTKFNFGAVQGDENDAWELLPGSGGFEVLCGCQPFRIWTSLESFFEQLEVRTFEMHLSYFPYSHVGVF